MIQKFNNFLSEAATRGGIKKVFLKISQVSFLGLQRYYESYSAAGVFLLTCEIVKNTFSTEHQLWPWRAKALFNANYKINTNY